MRTSVCVPLQRHVNKSFCLFSGSIPAAYPEHEKIIMVVDESGFADVVYNDFFIGDDADVDIVAGCGIHNDGIHLSQHDGVHTFDSFFW